MAGSTGWNASIRERLERPPIAALGGRAGQCRLRLCSVARVGRAHGDPLAEIGDDRGGQLGLGRHRLDAVGGGDRLIKQARVQVAGHDGRPRVPPARIAARLSTLSPPLSFLAWLEWHSWHFSTRTGRILVSKNATPLGSSPARAVHQSLPAIAQRAGRTRPAFRRKGGHSLVCPRDDRPCSTPSNHAELFNKSLTRGECGGH